MDYILRISSDFEKGDCQKCPVRYFTPDPFEEWCQCHRLDCPLEEVKYGEWIPFTKVTYDGERDGWECSVCGQEIHVDEPKYLSRIKLCSACGTIMKGERK